MRDDLLHRFLHRRTPRRFRALVEGTRTRLLTAAWRVLGDLSEAEDVVQEVYMKVLDEEREPESIQSGLGWLVSSTILRARTRLRALVRRRSHEAGRVVTSATPADAALEAANAEIRHAVTELSDDLRVCTELRYFGDLSSQEVAEALDLTPRAVDKRLKKAREELAPRLAPAALGVFDASATSSSVVPAFLETAAAGLEPRALWMAAKGTTAGATVSGGTIAATVLVLGLLAGGIGLALSSGDGDDDPTRAGSTRAHATAAEDVGDDGPRLAGRGEAPTEARDEAAEANASTTSATAEAFVIRILGPDGQEVDEGRMRLRPARIERAMSLGDLAKADPTLLRFAWMLDWFELEKHNPIRLAAVPTALHGIPFQAQFDVPGLWGTATIEIGPAVYRQPDIRLHATISVRVEVRDALDDRLLKDAVVRAETFGPGQVETVEWGSSSKEPPEGRTGEDGRVRLEGLSGAHTHVQVHALGHRSVFAPIEEVEGIVTVRLVPVTAVGAIEVTVYDEHAAPLPGAAVLLGYDLGLVRRTDGDGRVHFEDLPPDAYSVCLWEEALARFDPADPWAEPPATGPNVVLDRHVDLEPGRTEHVRLGLLPPGGGRLRIHVVDADANPRPGVRVSVSGAVRRMRATDAKGGVEFDDLPTGRWYVTAWWEHLQSDPPSTETFQVHVSDLAEGETRSARIVIGTTRLEVAFALPEGGAGLPSVRAISGTGQIAYPGAWRPDGLAVFESLAPGSWTIETHGSDTATARVRVPIRRDVVPEPVTMTIEHGGTVVLRYEKDDVRRLVDTTARLERAGGKVVRHLTPEPTGALCWTAGQVATGAWTLIVERPGEPTVKKEVVVEEEAELVIVL